MIGKRCVVFGETLFVLMALWLVNLQGASAEIIINETFEDVPVGSVPQKWGIAVSGGAKVAVIEKGNEWGKRCLLFQNALDAKQSYEPDLEIVVDLKGTIKLAFDVLMQDRNGQFRVAPRKDARGGQSSIAGPCLIIGNDGKVSANCANKWVHFGEMIPDEWIHVEMVMRMKTEENPSWDLIITRDGETKSFTNLAYTNRGQIPSMFTRLVFHGSNKNSSAIYFDNLMLEVTDSQTSLAEKKKVDRSKSENKNTDNLCLNVQRVRVEADTFISSRSQQHLGAEVLKRVIDGNRSTYWHAGRRRANLTISFPEPVTVSQSFWFHANVPAGMLDERGLKDYNIKISLDGKKWENVVAVRNYLGGKKHDTFPACRAQHVKLEILQVQGFLLPVLCEWELYAKSKPVPPDEQAWKPGTPCVEKVFPSILHARVTSEKMMYRPGEDVRLTVRLDNNRGSDGQFKVGLYHSCGIQGQQKLKIWNVSVRNGTSKVLRYTLRNVKREYGHCVVATIHEMDKEIARCDCVFEVADNWAKIARMNTDVGFEKLVPDLPREEIYNVHIPIWRKLYVNCVQFFSQHVYFSQHYTDKNKWGSPIPYWRAHTASAKTTCMWTSACKRSGIRIIGYSETGALSPELKFDILQPDWIIHGPLSFPESTKHLYAMWMYFKKMDSQFPKGKPIVAPDLHMFDAGDMHAMTDYLAKDFAKAVKRFGWEGSFFDSFSWALEDSAFGHARGGKPLNTLTPDEIGTRFLSRVKEEVYKTSGVRFAAVANFGLPEGLSPWHDENLDFEEFRKNRAIYRKTASEMGIFFLEQHPTPHLLRSKDPSGRSIYPQTIEDTVRALRLIREANDINVPVMLMPLQYTRRLNNTVVDANLLYSCSYASGVLLDMSMGTPPRALVNDPLSSHPLLATEANYNKFAARYGEYLFDLNIRWLPKGQVICSAPANVWWRNLVSCRKYDNEKMDIYVHLINRPDVPLTWGKKMNFPAPLSNIEVSIKDQKGKKLTGICCISPNGNHNPLRLETQHENGKTTVTVPRLEYWTMLVCRFEPKTR